MSDRPFAVGFLFGVFPVLLSYLNVGLDCINLAQVFLLVLNSDRHQINRAHLFGQKSRVFE